MSSGDPLERLRGLSDEPAPAADVIRARARRIERRRYVAMGGGATVVAVIAAVGIFVGSEPVRPARDLAQRAAGETTSDSAATTGGSAGTSGSQRSKGRVSAPEAGATGAQSVGGTQLAGKAVAAGGLEATIDVADRDVGRGAALTLKVCNKGADAVTREFGSGQRYDFEVSRDGDLVWRWSDGRAFTQETGSETWGPGKCKSWTETWSGTSSAGTPEPPGEYEAVGVLTSSPVQRTGPRKFCLDIC